MNSIDVDYLIIGGGIAGLTLKRFLKAERVVCLEPAPCKFKVGEAISPDHFDDPVLFRIGVHARRLPSYAEKWGSLFVFEDNVAVYPASTRGGGLALHIRRDELERLMIAEWHSRLNVERALEIDLDRKLVCTDRATYKVRHQILDCSGPTMLVARALGQMERLWDVYCSWFYLDVRHIDDHAFERWIDRTGRSVRIYDAKTGRDLERGDLRHWSPSRYTYLRNVRDGSWLWQIPLYRRRELSFGMTSVHGKITLEQLRDAMAEHLAPMFRAEPKPLDHRSPHHRLHVRNHFALRARTAATMDYILIGDAFFFGDPIYGTGTATTSLDALDVARTLNATGWTEEVCHAYNTRKAELVDHAVKAHYFSPHSQSADLDRDAAAVEGNAQQRIHTFNYASVIAQTKIGLCTNRDRRSMFESPYRCDPRELLAEMSIALGLTADSTLKGWKLSTAHRHPDGFELTWLRAGRSTLVVLLRRYAGVKDYYRRFGPMTLSYMNRFDWAYPLDVEVEGLFEAIGDALSTWSGWESGHSGDDAPRLAAGVDSHVAGQQGPDRTRGKHLDR